MLINFPINLLKLGEFDLRQNLKYFFWKEIKRFGAKMYLSLQVVVLQFNKSPYKNRIRYFGFFKHNLFKSERGDCTGADRGRGLKNDATVH